MKYNIIKILSSAACVFVFQNTLGDINIMGSGNGQVSGNHNGQEIAGNGHQVFYGILRQPLSVVARRMQAMRERERQQRIERQRRAALEQNEQETRQAIQNLHRLTEIRNELWNLETSNGIVIGDEQQRALRTRVSDLTQQVRSYITRELYSALQDYYNDRYSPFMSADLSESERENFISNLNQSNRNQHSQINSLIPQEIQGLEQRLADIQQEINRL